MYYILGIDLRLFQNISFWDHMHNSDHYLVLGCLHGTTLRENQLYLGMSTRLPLTPPR